MTDIQIIDAAIRELNEKSYAVTEQFLKIHQVIIEGGRPKVDRVDRDNKDGSAIVYFPIKKEKFFLAVSMDLYPSIEIRCPYMEPYNSVYFRASSKDLSLEELSRFTNLIHTGGRNKGDLRGAGGTGIVWPWPNSTIFFEPNPEPDAFEDKLGKLLDFLEQDKEGINRLVSELDGSIQVAIEFHNGNTMLGGPNINKECVHRMSALNLEIDFDLYVSGQPFR